MEEGKVRETLLAYEKLCQWAREIAVAYILAAGGDTGCVQKCTLSFEFPEVTDDGLDGGFDLDYYQVTWTERWPKGGYSDHRRQVPFHLLLMEREEAVAEVKAFKVAREREEGVARSRAEVAAKARRRVQYEKLKAEFEEE